MFRYKLGGRCGASALYSKLRPIVCALAKIAVGKESGVPTIVRWFVLTFALLSSLSYAGDLIVIGGVLSPLNEAVYRSVIERLDDSPVCILGTASSEPQEAAQSYLRDFTRYGATPVFVDISVDNASQSTSDGAVLEQLAACGGYFFTSGRYQQRITEALLADGEDTPALATLRARFEAGAVIAGTSSGAAALSEVMISGGSSVDTLLGGENTVSLEQGLGFASGVIFEPHFVERGRLGRLLGALVETATPLGVGISEDTALIVPEAGPWQVLGGGHVALLEMPEGATLDALKGILVSLLAGGDSFDPATGTFSIRLERISTEEIGYLYEAGDIFAVDAFGPGVLEDLLTRLVDSPERDASGLGFIGNSAARFTADGVRVMLRKINQTQGYYGEVSDADTHSVIRAELGIEPITVSVGPKDTTNAEDGETIRGERSP